MMDTEDQFILNNWTDKSHVPNSPIDSKDLVEITCQEKTCNMRWKVLPHQLEKETEKFCSVDCMLKARNMRRFDVVNRSRNLAELKKGINEKLPPKSKKILKNKPTTQRHFFTGQQINDWTLLRRAGESVQQSEIRAQWLCRCKCGNEVVLINRYIKRKQNCGECK